VEARAGAGLRDVDADGLALVQGLTLVHFSAQLERILWDRGAIEGCLGDV
jgi:hypothetical protein